jgi:general secretion pathway protein D
VPAEGTAGGTSPTKSSNVGTAPVEDVATNTFNFPAIDLNTFLNEFYAPMVGRTILRSANLPVATITLRTQTPLTRKEAIQAFDALLAMNGIAVINVGDKFMKVVPSAQAWQEAEQFSRGDSIELPEAARYVTHIVKLNYLKTSDVLPVLQPFGKIPSSVLAVEGSQMLVIRDYAENVKRMLEMLKEIDVAVPAEYISEVIPIKYALASDIQSALSSLSAGGGAATVGTTGARGGGGARTTGRPTTPGYPGSTSGVPGQPGTTPLGATTPGTTMAGAAGGAQPSFTDRLRQIVQKAGVATGGEFQIIGPNKIIADERTNSLLVFASRQDMAMIKDIISKLDVVLAQVIIEALIMEVTLSDSQNYGVSWLNQPHTTGKFTQYGAIQNDPSFQDPLNILGGSTNIGIGNFASGLSWWGKYGNDFDVAAQAAASDSRVHVLSRPRIQTSHAVPATITIGTSQPIVTGTYSYYGGPQTQFAYQNFGITLNVTPLINPDGLVVMDIDQSIQSDVGQVSVGGGLTEPILANRSANAKVAVRSRETVMLGGFISSQISSSKSGVPLLKDIPLLGMLFTSASKSHDRTELIVLIRPTVLQTPEIAAAAAKEEQEKMPLIKRAQQDERSFQDKLNKSGKDTTK